MKMTPRRRRLALVVFIVAGVGLATGLTLSALNENLLYFHSTSMVVNGEHPEERNFRMGGIVKDGSVERDPDSMKVRFVVTDTATQVPVLYEGILPDLFREGQGIVATGRMNGDGEFRAEEVLAKHDEEYMPPDVADSVKMAHEAGVKRAKNEGGGE